MPSLVTLLQILFGLATDGVFFLIAHALSPQRARLILAVGLAGAAAVYVGFAVWWGAPLTWLDMEVGEHSFL